MAEKITAQMVKSLREQTGAGMMECKKALQEAGGDMDQASEIIQKAGHKKAAKKADRTAAEGIIVCKISDDKKFGVMIEINSETDFVARDENFKAFSEQLINLALSKKAKNLDELLALNLSDNQTVEQARQALIAKIGENVNIRRIECVDGDEGLVEAYLHGTKIGVLVHMVAGDETLAKDIAMHVAAMRPICVNSDEVPSDLIEREKRIAKERALESGKPEQIVDKIVEGQVQKFLNEMCLMGQNFVKDQNSTVKKPKYEAIVV